MARAGRCGGRAAARRRSGDRGLAVAIKDYILIGPPGGGKGTQAERLTRKHAWAHIATGDILREHVRNGTELGKKAKQYMDAGDLVPDELIIGMMERRLDQPDARKGALLDGFPRSAPQAEALEKMLERKDREIGQVIDVEVPDEEIVQRITGRRICRECGVTYHVKFNPPAEGGKCRQCGSADLYQRDDDNESTVRKRLEVYHRQTEPLLDYYGGRDLVRNVNGVGTLEEVTERIEKALAD